MSETIINGIDVSECEKLGETIDGFTCGLGKRIRFANEIITKHNLCKDNPNCYFKQFKRLQKENKELKARFIELYNNAEQLANKYNKYSGNKENELVEIINKTTDKRNKYKQAIEEIRNIAKNYCNACDEFKAKTFKNKNDCLYCNYGFIRRKINEVLNDRD